MKKIFLIIVILLSTNLVFAYDFFPDREWCQRNGVISAEQYWKNISGLSSGSINNLMYKGLGTLGYTGDLNDRLHKYLVDQTGQTGSLTFLMNYYNKNINLVGGTDALLLENGSYILLENGSKILLE